MATKKRNSSPEADSSHLKRAKTEEDQKYNPYLAHMDQNASGSGIPKGSPLEDFTRRSTTAKQASKAEDGDNNPFTGRPHSQQYFGILESRRNLPVHKQR